MADLNSLDPNFTPDVNGALSAPQVVEPQEAPKSRYNTFLMQKGSNALVEVPQDELDVAIRSGEYLPKKDASFIVRDAEGQTYNVLGENLHEALQSGLLLENSAERHAREMQEQYGGIGGQAAALGLGTASGLTAGLSNVAASALGYGQTVADVQEANPAATTTGEVLGTIGGLAAGSAEAGLAAKTLGATAKGVQALGVGAEKALLKTLTKAGLSEKVGAKFAAKVVQGATEGGALGYANYLSEDALGKIDSNAENVMAYVGMGAVMGGALNGALHLGSEAVSKVSPFLKKGKEEVGSRITDTFLDKKSAYADLLGYTPTQFEKQVSKDKNFVNKLDEYVLNDLKLSTTQTARDRVKLNATLRDKAGAEIDSLVNMAPDVAHTTRQNLFSGLYEDIVASEKYKPYLDSISAGTSNNKKFNGFLKYLEEQAQSAEPLNMKQLQEIRQYFEVEGRYGKQAGALSLMDDLRKDAADFVRGKMRDAASNMGEEYAKRFRDANRIYSISTRIEPMLGKSIQGISTIEQFTSGLAADLKTKAVLLGYMDKMKQKVSSATSSSIKHLFKEGRYEAVKYVPTRLVNSIFAGSYREEKQKYDKPRNETEAYQNLQKNFERYAANPDALLQRVNRHTASLYNHAPQTSIYMDGVVTRAAQFLDSKIDKKITNKGASDIFKRVRPPSKIDAAKFERYITAIEQPMEVLNALSKGRLSFEHVEALRAVYPTLYNQIRDDALQVIQEHTNIPYQAKLQLGILLGAAVDESMVGENVLALQSNFQTAEQTTNGPQGGGTKPINIASKFNTGEEERRENT